MNLTLKLLYSSKLVVIEKTILNVLQINAFNFFLISWTGLNLNKSNVRFLLLAYL
jgi:hypothetical protein